MRRHVYAAASSILPLNFGQTKGDAYYSRLILFGPSTAVTIYADLFAPRQICRKGDEAMEMGKVKGHPNIGTWKKVLSCN